MIKFNCIIHKETGTVIKYEDWLNCYKQNGNIALYGDEICLYPSEEKDEEFTITAPCSFIIKAKEMIFFNDFEIIYDSEFTLEELEYLSSSIYALMSEFNESEEDYRMADKIDGIIEQRKSRGKQC